MWTKSGLTLTHLMKQKRNLKENTNLKNNFQNTSQHEEAFRRTLLHFYSCPLNCEASYF